MGLPAKLALRINTGISKRLAVLVGIGLFACVILCQAWFDTRHGDFCATFTVQAQHFELHIESGSIILVHVTNWWVELPFQLFWSEFPSGKGPSEWIGYRVSKCFGLPGLELAVGSYIGPLMDWSNPTWMSPWFSRGRGHRFSAIILPLWLVCGFCLLPCGMMLYKSFGQIKQQKSEAPSS